MASEGYDVLEDNEHLSLWDDETQEWAEAQPSPRARFFTLLLLSIGIGVGFGALAILMFVVSAAVFTGGAILGVMAGV